MARRTLVGAAWSAPVIAAAVSAPTAVASPGATTATLVWDGPRGVQKESSLLVLTLTATSAGTPVVAGTGTLTLTVIHDYASRPARSVSAPVGWAVIDSGSTITMIAPAGVPAGVKGFNVEWGELSGNWTTVATWTESDATGAVSASIEVGPRGFPTLEWTTNPVVYGGTSTLRLTVPADSYALGYQGMVVLTAELPADSVIDLPSGWTLHPERIQGLTYLLGPATVAGRTDFGFAFGTGSTPVEVDLQWISPTAPGTTPISPRPVLALVPA